MTQEEIEDMRDGHVSYFYVPPANYKVMDKYRDLDHRWLYLAAYIYTSFNNSKMPKTTIAGKDFIWISGALAISRLSNLGFTNTSTVSRVLHQLCGTDKEEGDDRPFLLTCQMIGTQSGKKLYIAPTNELLDLFTPDMGVGAQTKKALDTGEPESTTEAIEHEFSSEFLQIYEELSESDRFSKMRTHKVTGEPNKYCIKADGYIREILDGSFYNKHGKDMKKKPSLEGIDVDKIIDGCLSCSMPGTTAYPDQVFVHHTDKTYSPFLTWLDKQQNNTTPKKQNLLIKPATDITEKEKRLWGNHLGSVNDILPTITEVDPFVVGLYRAHVDYFDKENIECFGKQSHLPVPPHQQQLFNTFLRMMKEWSIDLGEVCTGLRMGNSKNYIYAAYCNYVWKTHQMKISKDSDFIYKKEKPEKAYYRG